jgi:ELWxxDGT repeat protein
MSGCLKSPNGRRPSSRVIATSSLHACVQAALEPLEFRTLLSTTPTVTQLSSIGTLSAQQPQQFATLGNKELFTTNDPSRGQILWSTDGTSAGTQEIAALDTSGNSSNWANYSATYPDD